MSETKHTPGPWIVDPIYLSEVQTPDFKTISSCWHEHADGAEITVTGVLPCSLEESAANARLIAAAPDLLLNLKNAIDIIEKHVPRDALGVDHMGDFSVPGGVMTWAVLDEHLHYMRKTVSKAEGSLT